MNDVDEGGRVGSGRLVQEPIQLHKRDFPATANTRFLKPSNQLQQKAPEHRCGRRSSCGAIYFVAGNDGNVVTVKTDVWVTPARRGEAGLTLARIILVPRVILVQILRYSLLLPLGAIVEDREPASRCNHATRREHACSHDRVFALCHANIHDGSHASDVR